MLQIGGFEGEEKVHGEAGLGKYGERPPFLLPLSFCCPIDLGLGRVRGVDEWPRDAMPG
jgi:hypothetical protein